MGANGVETINNVNQNAPLELDYKRDRAHIDYSKIGGGDRNKGEQIYNGMINNPKQRIAKYGTGGKTVRSLNDIYYNQN